MNGRVSSRAGRGWKGSALGLLFTWALAQHGLACSGGSAYPESPPPGGELQPHGVRLRLQERAVRKMAEHAADLVRAHLPTRWHAGRERAIIELTDDTLVTPSGTLTPRDGCIGPTSVAACPPRGAASDATLGPTYRSRIEIALDTLVDALEARLLPTSPGQAPRATMTFTDVEVFVDMAVVLESSAGQATCLVRDATAGQGAARLATLTVTMQLGLDDPSSAGPTLTGLTATLSPLDTLASQVLPCNGGACDDPLCHPDTLDADCVGLCTTGQLAGPFVELSSDVVAPVLDAHLPLALRAVLAELPTAPLQSAHVVTLQDLLELPQSLWGQPTPLGAALRLGDAPFEVSGPSAGRGVSLGLTTGVTATPSGCAPTVSPPNYSLLRGPAPFFDGSLELTDPPRVVAYHAVMTVSVAALTQAMFALYDAGALCVTLTPEISARLSEGTFASTLGLFADDAPELYALGPPDAPVSFQLHPTTAPKVRLTDARAEATPQGPRVVLDLGEVGLSAYAHLDDGIVRLFTLAGDVVFDLAVQTIPGPALRLVPGELTLTDLIPVYGEFTAPRALQPLAERVLRLMLEGLVGGAPMLDLDVAGYASALLGGAPVDVRVNALERHGEPTNGYLSAYLSFCPPLTSHDGPDPACQ